jgi:hypothetical protein
MRQPFLQIALALVHGKTLYPTSDQFPGKHRRLLADHSARYRNNAVEDGCDQPHAKTSELT